MKSQDEFESVLKLLADPNFGFAADEDDEEGKILVEIAREWAELASTDERAEPGEFFTYEHPVLALAAGYYYKNGDQVGIGVAEDGDDLRHSAILGWIRTGWLAWNAHLEDPERTLLEKARAGAPIKYERETVRVAILGDAGYAGAPQRRVLERIQAIHRERPFDLVVHLGDVYFSGSGDEMETHFLKPFQALRDAGMRVVTLCGNHDLYNGSGPYLKAIETLEQPGRYFAVETPHWRIACLDTSSPAMDVRRNDGWLDREQKLWLEGLADGAKPLILMSHHHVFSNWEKPTATLREQLSEWAAKNVFAWYWGHEHHLAYYDRGIGGFHAACVGNGAFLENWSAASLDRSPYPIWHADKGCLCFGEASLNRWPHGFLELELGPNSLHEFYHAESAMVRDRELTSTTRPADG